MALTLECSCDQAELCILESLTFHVEWKVAAGFGECPQDWDISLNGSSFSVGATPSTWPPCPDKTESGSADVILDISKAVAEWDSLRVVASIASTANEGCHFPGYTLSFTYYIRQHWKCLDPVTNEYTEWDVYSYGTGSDGQICWQDGDMNSGVIEYWGSGSNSSGFVTQYCSASMRYCAGISISLAGFGNKPSNPTLKVPNFCLCAAGGTEPYVYTVAGGQLPCGESLDPSTGCIVGAYDGTCQGTGAVTFQVTDSAGATAQTTCSVIPECGSGAPAPGNRFF